ncbi:MAG TPA: CBM9 family sugar-binding protein [Pseudomonadales bacterium]|nr:CBM9 family sugar-binding protein [Pseudomonadales bacterium]
MSSLAHLVGITSLALSIPLAAMEAIKTKDNMLIDGRADEAVWQQATWHPLDQLMVGNMPTAEDFSGRFKLAWDETQLYLIAEIIDDVIFDSHPNPYDRYWDDDTLEVFIDEDASGGHHLYSYNAFAYHIGLDGNVADFGQRQDEGVVLLNDHVTSVWTRQTTPPYAITWEVAILIYDDSFDHLATNIPVKLTKNKVMGFMLAYCDNDGSSQREHFMGSHAITPRHGDKNLGYIDASVFGKLKLVD